MKLDPLFLNPGATIDSTGFLFDAAVSGSSAASGHVVVPERRFSGKWYFEILSRSGNVYVTAGIKCVAATVTPPAQWTFPVGNFFYAVRISTNGTPTLNGNVWNNGVVTSPYGTLPDVVAGDIWGIAFDAGAGKLWFAQNGVWMSGGDPAAGTSADITGLTNAAGYVPTISSFYTVVSAVTARLANKSNRTATITNASPGVVTVTGHGFAANQRVTFTTTGGLPTGLSVGTTYYVIPTGLATDSFQVSATLGGSAVNTSSAGSGTHKCIELAPLGVAGGNMLAYPTPSGFTAWGTPARTFIAASCTTGATLSNGNRTIASGVDGANYQGGVCDEGMYLRKTYFEGLFDSGTIGALGVARTVGYDETSATFDDFNAAETKGSTTDYSKISVLPNGEVYANDTLVYSGPSFSASETCQIAVDPANGKLWVGKNNTWFLSGDPATGANPTVTFSTAYQKVCWHAAAIATALSSAWQITVNFGSTAPTHTPPVGFSMMGAWYDTLAAAVAAPTTMAKAFKVIRSFATSAAAATAFTRNYSVARTFTTSTAIATAFTATKLKYATIATGVVVTAAMAKKATYNVAIGSTVAVVTVFDELDGSYTGWVANIDIGAHSMYQDFNFNSFSSHEGEYYAVKSDGIYLLGGTTDAASRQIVSRVMTGAENMDSEQQKRVTTVYLGIRANGRMMLKVMTDEGALVYNMNLDNAKMAEARQKIGRGTRQNFWQFELTNLDSAQFELESISIQTVALQRRIK